MIGNRVYGILQGETENGKLNTDNLSDFLVKMEALQKKAPLYQKVNLRLISD